MYDTDVTTWSPQGRLHQVEYAMEAIKQGSAVVGVRSKTHAVLAALRRAPQEGGTHQKKIFDIDEHVGMAISGLTADARSLAKFMRGEAQSHQYIYSSAIPLSRLVTAVADKSQVHTQRSDKRPYGVGLLIAGADSTGVHLYSTDPAGNYFEWKAHTIGARSQSAKTYLEKHFEQFAECSLDDLIKHALLALRETSPNGELNVKNCEIAIVTTGSRMEIVRDEKIAPHLAKLEGEPMQYQASSAAPADTAPGSQPADSMDTGAA
eukprot:tig00000217_g19154.t1